MARNYPVTLIAPFILAFALSTTSAERKIAVDSIPIPVLDAFKISYPSAQILQATKETTQGTVTYEIESTDGSARRDIIYTKEGKAAEIEDMIRVDSLPGAVKSAIAAQFGTAAISRAEKLTKGSIIEYEVAIGKGRKQHEIVLKPDGQIISGGKNERAGEGD